MNALALNFPPITRAKRVRERACARSASFSPIVRAYCLRECWKMEPAKKKKTFRKTQSSVAEKRERERARWIRARPSLHMFLRQATTPTSRRWKGVHAALEFRRFVHAALEFRVLRVTL